MKNITQNSKQNNLIYKIKQFFFTNGWEPLPYQIKSWEAFLNGESGIIQVPTGCGKTYAALMGPLSKIEDPKNNKSVNILLITPLKALTRDLKNSIQCAALHFNKEITGFSTLAFLTPVFALLSGGVWLDERLTIVQWIGVVFVLISVFFVSQRKSLWENKFSDTNI